ncbi:hypothetical protein E2P81_ATG07940 [Venturia nashicola]|nr:hypothetical protein E2P81_ATG07940 [Venturia nashicola]
MVPRRKRSSPSAGRPISCIQSAPVLTSHEILAGYESMTRNKSLELFPPDRPPPSNYEATARPCHHLWRRPAVESSENASQLPNPSKNFRLVVPVQAKEVADVIEPAANLPPRTPTPEKLRTREKPRKRKSYRNSFSTRIRRLIPKHHSEKRLTKAPTFTTIATADTTTQPDLESFFKPDSKQQDSEKYFLVHQMVQERDPDEIQVDAVQIQ